MLYMLACMVLMVCIMCLMVSTLKDKFENIDNSRTLKSWALSTFVTSGAVFLLLSPMFITLFRNSVSDNLSLFAQWAGLAGGLLLIGIYGWSFLRNRAFFPGLISICGATLVFIFANNLLFVSSHNAGVLNYGELSQMTKISDVECKSQMMSVKLAEKNKPSEWRCPQGFVLLGMSSTPFIPWPTYTTGKSLELSEAIHTMMDGAQDVTKKKD